MRRSRRAPLDRALPALSVGPRSNTIVGYFESNHCVLCDAQCRELPKGNCEDTAEWRCPGWADCPEDYESCYDAKCCKGHKVGCFKRATRQFAQCRRYEGNKEDCRSGDTWLCPGTWEQCSPTMHSCQESRCCDHADHKCCTPQPRRMPPPGLEPGRDR